MSKCTDYVFLEDDDGLELCRCPICKGFLPRDFPSDRLFKCKKCGTELMCFPNKVDGSDEQDQETGRICPISNRGTGPPIEELRKKTKIKTNLGWVVEKE